MSIETRYREILIEQFISAKVKAGEIPSAQDIQDEVELILDSMDLSVPQFEASSFQVLPKTNTTKESASASKFNSTFKALKEDLRVAFSEMLYLGKTTTGDFERWRLESEVLEKRLIDLEDRIENLLLLTKDTEGYHSFIIDNFTDGTLVDQELTTALLDPSAQLVTINEDIQTDTVSRIFLDDIDPETSITFKVKTTESFVARKDAVGSSLHNPFKQSNSIWWTEITTSKSIPVSCELTIKLSDTPISLTKILLELHDSSRSSPMVITPLYSVDNYNYFQLPTSTYTQEVRSDGVFSFSPVQVTHIKFVLIKSGPDPVDLSKLTYQFGFKEISFYQNSFLSEEGSQLFSRPLSILDSITNDPIPFSKVSLETCERIEEGTDIKYFIYPSNDSLAPVTDSTVWFPISPVNRVTPSAPLLLYLGDIEEVEIGVDEVLTLSYNGLTSDADASNPSNEFQLLSLSGSTLFDQAVPTSKARFAFFNSNERILNYQIKDTSYTGSGLDPIDIDTNSIILFRNVGEKGLGEDELTDLVRDIQRGWSFEDPYYSCVIQILNPNGMSINVGSNEIIVDDKFYSNSIPASILSGKTSLTTGIHRIKVNKNNWLHVTPQLQTLDELKAADTLYPFNHKLLIEGYDYDTSYPSSSEKVYTGADLFAEVLMVKVSSFDLTRSVGNDMLTYFATDRDVPDTHAGGNESTLVFLIKVDETNPDFTNERFVLKFKQVNQRFNYLRLRADFSSESNDITPALDSYKLKVGG